MIATQLENTIRNKLFGFIVGRFNPALIDLLQVYIIQCMENSLRHTHGRLYTCDRFHIEINREFVPDHSYLASLQYKTEDFIGSYMEEAMYAVTSPVSVEIEVTRQKLNNGISVHGYFSDTQDYARQLCLVVSRIRKNDGGFLFFRLDIPGKYMVGRSGRSDISLDDPGMSNEHALLYLYEHGDFFIKDLRSLNGTIINGKRLDPDEKYEMSVGDTVCTAGIYELLVRKIITTESN
ncbi:FHA domain-containing protein [candidate division KSB1 bacterium]